MTGSTRRGSRGCTSASPPSPRWATATSPRFRPPRRSRSRVRSRWVHYCSRGCSRCSCQRNTSTTPETSWPQAGHRSTGGMRVTGRLTNRVGREAWQRAFRVVPGMTSADHVDLWPILVGRRLGQVLVAEDDLRMRSRVEDQRGVDLVPRERDAAEGRVEASPTGCPRHRRDAAGGRVVRRRTDRARAPRPTSSETWNSKPAG